MSREIQRACASGRHDLSDAFMEAVHRDPEQWLFHARYLNDDAGKPEIINGRPYGRNPYQLRLDAAWLDPKRYELVRSETSMRTGKTEEIAHIGTRVCSGWDPSMPREYPLAVGAISLQRRQSKMTLRRAMRRVAIAGTLHENNSDDIWTYTVDGTKTAELFWCSSAGTIKQMMGATVHCWLIDEECPQEMFEEALNRCIGGSGRLLNAFSPFGGVTWSEERILNWEDEHWSPIVQGTVWDNVAYLPGGADEIERMRRQCHGDEDLIRMRLYGQRVSRYGRVYPRFQIEKHVVAPSEIPRNEDCDAVVWCADYGDPGTSASYVLYFRFADHGGPRLWVKSEYYGKAEYHLHVKKFREQIEAEARIDYFTIDPTPNRKFDDGRDLVRHLQQDGIPVRPARTSGVDWMTELVREWMARTNGDAKPRLLWSSACPMSIREHSIWENRPVKPSGALREDARPTIGKKGVHSCQALWYGARFVDRYILQVGGKGWSEFRRTSKVLSEPPMSPERRMIESGLVRWATHSPLVGRYTPWWKRRSAGG